MGVTREIDKLRVWNNNNNLISIHLRLLDTHSRVNSIDEMKLFICNYFLFLKVSLDTKISIGYSHNSWTKHPNQEFYKAKRTDLVAWWVSDCNEFRTHR